MHPAPSKPVTLRDIARAIGVTVSTVSKTLNNHPEISPNTKDRIWQEVKRQNYVPNALARNLRARQSNFIAIIVADAMNPYFQEIIRGAEEVISENTCFSFIFDNEESSEKEIDFIRQLRALSVGGVIVTVAQGNMQSIELLEKFNIPFVLINRYVTKGKDNYVVVDDHKSAYIATSYLVSKWNRKTIFINGHETVSSARDRRTGYIEALSDHEGNYEPRIYQGCIDQKSGFAVADQILSQHELPLSIFCYSDFVASGVIRVCLDRQLRIPEDVAVMGVDNIEIFAFSHPRLSTIDVPKRAIGRKAAELLFEVMGERNGEPRQIVVTPTILLRESA